MAPRLKTVLLWALLGGGAAVAVLVLWRGFFWQHALIIGLAVAALIYSGWRTFDRLRELHRRWR